MKLGEGKGEMVVVIEDFIPGEAAFHAASPEVTVMAG